MRSYSMSRINPQCNGGRPPADWFGPWATGRSRGGLTECTQRHCCQTPRPLERPNPFNRALTALAMPLLKRGMWQTFQLSKELVIEVLITTAAFLLIFVIAVTAEWLMNFVGNFFGAGPVLGLGARVFKYALSIFDVYIFGLMMYRILKRHHREMRDVFPRP